jgi:hypothetical protein
MVNNKIDYIKNIICNIVISIINLLPFSKKNISILIRSFHFIFPLFIILPLCFINETKFKYVYFVIIFIIITQIVFDTCLLTDIEEHYTENIENMTSVSVSILKIVGYRPIKKNKQILTMLVTIWTLCCVLLITYYRYTYN